MCPSSSVTLVSYYQKKTAAFGGAIWEDSMKWGMGKWDRPAYEDRMCFITAHVVDVVCVTRVLSGNGDIPSHKSEVPSP